MLDVSERFGGRRGKGQVFLLFLLIVGRFRRGEILLDGVGGRGLARDGGPCGTWTRGTSRGRRARGAD